MCDSSATIFYLHVVSFGKIANTVIAIKSS